ALLVRLGNAAFDADEHRLAVRAYERALALKGDDANVLTDVGVSYRSLGDLDKALASFEKALQVEPDHWQAVFNQVIVYGIDRGDRKKGLELLDRLKKLKGKFPEIPPLDQLEATLGAGG
ncbi:MAG: tetratricopeptide repeat protein, partial [Acidobacteria bacterium ACB2]|nr:tetratricopeptide repeat protein [Acidobacteria bacterium ACB2]